MFSRLSYFDKKAFIRRVIFALLILACFLLQSSFGLKGIFGARVFWLIPAAVSIAMFEREVSGMLFALFAGALWDSVSVHYSFNAVFFTLVGFTCGMLISHLMRNNLSSALLMTSGATVLYSFIYWLGAYVFSGTGGAGKALLVFFIPSGFLTILVTPPMYFLVRAIVKRFRSATNR